ncbi:type IV secretion system protein VirB7 [Wolbachia pipientis]|nr:type IV secretion system protein VirB7 [Wolbachia pipientis]
MFKKLLFFVLAVFMLSGCFLSKQRKLKSPCIKSNESISCELYSVNDHWLDKYRA